MYSCTTSESSITIPERTITVLTEGENITVALPLRSSVGQVISGLFEKAKELKRKTEGAEKRVVVEESRKSIVEVVWCA